MYEDVPGMYVLLQIVHVLVKYKILALGDLT